MKQIKTHVFYENCQNVSEYVLIPFMWCLPKISRMSFFHSVFCLLTSYFHRAQTCYFVTMLSNRIQHNLSQPVFVVSASLNHKLSIKTFSIIRGFQEARHKLLFMSVALYDYLIVEQFLRGSSYVAASV